VSRGNQGIQSKNKVRVPQRLGSGANRVQKAGVAQLGQHVGDHATNRGATGYTGERLTSNAPTFDPVRYGNEVAATTQCGVGGSRTIYKTGSQGVQGNPNPGKPMTAGDPLAPWARK
jgi:hypothetical protein